MVGASLTQTEQLRTALLYMRTALGYLDAINAPADIGAHLDLAIERLKTLLADA